MNLDWVGSVFESGNNFDWTQTMRDINSPVLLALGAHDFVAPPSAWTTANTPSHWTLHRFDRSGHTPYLEEADEFVRASSTWLALLED